MFDKLRLSATQIGVAAGVLCAAAGLSITAATGTPLGIQLASSSETPGDISGPCDEAEHAEDPRCSDVSVTIPDVSTTSSTTSTPPSSTTSPTSSTSTTSTTTDAEPTSDVRSFDAAGAGTITYEVDGSTLRLLSVTPTEGWSVDVEQPAGIQIDLDLRSGTKRVQVDVEFEHGQIRERVRLRDDATDERIETTNGVDTETSTADDSGSDDRSGRDSESDDSGGDDRSGSNSGSDDDSGDDRSGSNSGSDDSGSDADSHSGSSHD